MDQEGLGASRATGNAVVGIVCRIALQTKHEPTIEAEPISRGKLQSASAMEGAQNRRLNNAQDRGQRARWRLTI